VRNCYITGGVLISFQISRSTGVSIATAFFNHDFQMFIVKSYQKRNQKKMLQSQNECCRSRLNKMLIVKWDCDLIE